MDQYNRYTQEQCRKMDEVLEKRIRKDIRLRRLLLDKLRPEELLNYMTSSVYRGPQEEIQRECRNNGLRSGTSKFLDLVPRYKGWSLQFLDALYHTGMRDVASQVYSDDDDDEYGSGDNGEGGDDSGGGSGGSRNCPSNDSNTVPYERPPSYDETLHEDRIKQRLGRRIYERDQETQLLNSESDTSYVNNFELTRGATNQPASVSRQLPERSAEVPSIVGPSQATRQEPVIRQNDGVSSQQSIFNSRSTQQTSRSDAPSQPSSFHLSRSSVAGASSTDTVDQIIRRPPLNDLTEADRRRNKTPHSIILNVDDETEITSSYNNPVSENSNEQITISERAEAHSESPSTSGLKQHPVSSQVNDGNEDQDNNSYFQTVSLPFKESTSSHPSEPYTSSDILISDEEEESIRPHRTPVANEANTSSSASEMRSSSSSNSSVPEEMEESTSVSSENSKKPDESSRPTVVPEIIKSCNSENLLAGRNNSTAVSTMQSTNGGETYSVETDVQEFPESTTTPETNAVEDQMALARAKVDEGISDLRLTEDAQNAGRNEMKATADAEPSAAFSNSSLPRDIEFAGGDNLPNNVDAASEEVANEQVISDAERNSQTSVWPRAVVGVLAKAFDVMNSPYFN